MWSGNGNAPHVYLSSGPGGRGGYWAIDERGRYVWYQYVGPNRFEKDESTAIDVDQARRSHQRPTTDSSRLTGELRRRPGRERVFNRGRQRPGGGRRRRPPVNTPTYYLLTYLLTYVMLDHNQSLGLLAIMFKM